MSCIELFSLYVLSGELEDAKLTVRLTDGEGEEFLGLLILKAFDAVLVKLIFSTLLVLNIVS